MGSITREDADRISAWLQTHEFTVAVRIGGPDSPFGDEQTTWQRGDVLIRLTADRGQWWYEASISGHTQWLDVDHVASGTRDQLPVDRVAAAAGWLTERRFRAQVDTAGKGH